MKSLVKKYFDRVPTDKDEAYVELQGDLAVQIEETLKELNWSQRDLAKHSGVNPVNISRILSGENNTTLKTIAALQAGAMRRLVSFPWVEKRVEEIEAMNLVTASIGGNATVFAQWDSPTNTFYGSRVNTTLDIPNHSGLQKIYERNKAA